MPNFPKVKDTHSHSRPDEIVVTHLDLDLDVDFSTRQLAGKALFAIARAPGIAADTPLRLDAKALEIRSARSGIKDLLLPTTYSFGAGDAIRGEELVLKVAPTDTHVEVEFATTAGGTGLQWLDPSQTAGKKKPYLFSQSQAIHARTWFPCQDTPGVRMTYSAKIRCPEGFTAVMSAELIGTDPAGNEFRFEMREPIPSYLVALAVGDVVFRPLGDRCGVWAEREVADRAAAEFADTESMVRAVEKLYGPYRWGRYDILVLPPSFPFGGMENPRMTFATPTVLAGDKSGVSLIAHELAHSWSGNLVTNATWSDFWLNEGFTVYLEQRIMEVVFGRARYEMEVSLGMQELADEMAELEPRDQILHVDLLGRDPDEGFTSVPYQKGAAFLRLLETTFGRDTFDPFLRRWFDGRAFRSVTTADFLEHLKTDLFASDPAKAATIQTVRWIEEPGLPPEAPTMESEAFQKIDAIAKRFLSGEIGAEVLDAAGWSTHEWLRFLAALGEKPSIEVLTSLDRTFELSRITNAEITCVWLEIGIKADYRSIRPRLESFLTEQGRRKFLKPLYQAMAKSPEWRPIGLEIYGRARPLYHAIAAQSIDALFESPGR